MLHREFFRRRKAPRPGPTREAGTKTPWPSTGPAAAALPIPFFGADSGDILNLQIAGAVLIAALAGLAVVTVRLIRARTRERGARERMMARAAVLGAATRGGAESYWCWPGGAADDPGICGDGLAALLGPADQDFSTFDAVTEAFAPGCAGDLRDNVAALRRTGSPFTLSLQGASGSATFEARGVRCDATEELPAMDVVWFRDVSDWQRQLADLRDRGEILIAQNADYRNVLDPLGIPVWVRGKELELVYCNRAYAAAVEAASPAAAVAAGAEIAGGPTGWGRGLAEEARKDNAAVTRSAHVVAGGKRRLMEITELPIGTAGGSWQMMGMAIDRTDAEEARADLSRHMMAHGEVLESLGTGIVIFGPDTKLQFANTAFARMWELDDSWLMTQPTHGEILEDLRARRLYPDQPDFQEFKREVMELYTTLIEPREELLYLPDERVLRTVTNTHPLGGLLMTFEDVTDRLTLERSYNTLIDVQSETLDNLHEGVVVFGSDGRIRLSNPGYARIWKLDAASLKGEPRLADIIEATRDLFVYDGPWESFRDKILAGAMDRQPRSGRFERSDGSVLDYAAVPLPDGAVMFSYIDVTDTVSVQRALAERNEALLTADRLKSEFITNVSYELRTPLNSIIGFTEILSNQYFGALNERQQGYAENILQASRLLLSLIDNILDLALIDAGRLVLERSSVDIPGMMEAVVDLVRSQKHGVDLKLDCPADIGTLDGDERRLKQVLFNLLTNAITHTPEGGRISLTVHRADGTVGFSVADSGPGIPEEDIERVLGRFETGQGGSARGKGLGLGLALVKSFVELHGGHLHLASVPGEGTTVSFDIPVSEGERPAE
ncbi:MAG: PAS-domain containing protein [Alphaproteobacteria bacterium]|nr:PAS-domain containing protein [Alphaproteobacteria bacterium]